MEIDRFIYLTLSGSHAYGMAQPESDIDVRGICIPSKEYFLGFYKKFEQYENDLDFFTYNKIEKIINRKILKDEKVDSVIYGLHKFIKLAADCNPNIIELLFSDKSNHILYSSFFEELEENKDLFISARARFTFSGYAHSQLKRIKSHRSWLLNPPKEKPNRKKFGLEYRTVIPKDQLQAAESLIKKTVNKWISLDDELPKHILLSIRKNTIESIKEIWQGLSIKSPLKDDEYAIDELSKAAGKCLGYSDNFLEYLDRERHYRNALREYNQYENWKSNRNVNRANLEKKYGYDTKHAAHLVRLLRMAKEIISEGKVIVKRPDAEELLDIRKGKWTYDQLIEWSEKIENEISDIYISGNYKIPKKPNLKEIDKICIKITEKALNKERLNE